MSDPLPGLIAALERELPSAMQLRRVLHGCPEPGHAEHRTLGHIVAALGPPSALAGTAAMHVAGSGGKGVAIRAELDGLPVRERTGAPFASGNGWMHACGHDVHVAALVALVRAVRRVVSSLPAPLIALWQPSEEAEPSGAQHVLDAGVINGHAAALVAAHVHPEAPWGDATADGGVINAGADEFVLRITGRGGHSAYPHRARDPVAAAAALVTTLNGLADRIADPMNPARVSVTRLQAGTATNVIPASAEIAGLVRAMNAGDRTEITEALRTTAQAVAAAHGCVAAVELTPGDPPLDNDSRIAAAMRRRLVQACLAVAAPLRTLGADDAARYGTALPVFMTFVGLGGAPGFAPRSLHDPEFLPPDSAVRAVARAQAAAYVAAADVLALTRGEAGAPR